MWLSQRHDSYELVLDYFPLDLSYDGIYIGVAKRDLRAVLVVHLPTLTC